VQVWANVTSECLLRALCPAQLGYDMAVLNSNHPNQLAIQWPIVV